MKRFIEFILENRVVKTSAGSVIKRSKYGVGKDIGGNIYLHKQYENVIPEQEALKNAKKILGSFQYNVLKFDKDGNFTFFNSPDFNDADEPVAGKYVRIGKDGSRKESETKNIWHHKWLWVKDDYKGFNVGDSFKRSERWLKLPDINFSKIGNPSYWKTITSRLK